MPVPVIWLAGSISIVLFFAACSFFVNWLSFRKWVSRQAKIEIKGIQKSLSGTNFGIKLECVLLENNHRVTLYVNLFEMSSSYFSNHKKNILNKIQFLESKAVTNVYLSPLGDKAVLFNKTTSVQKFELLMGFSFAPLFISSVMLVSMQEYSEYEKGLLLLAMVFSSVLLSVAGNKSLFKDKQR